MTRIVALATLHTVCNVSIVWLQQVAIAIETKRRKTHVPINATMSFNAFICKGLLGKHVVRVARMIRMGTTDPMQHINDPVQL